MARENGGKPINPDGHTAHEPRHLKPRNRSEVTMSGFPRRVANALRRRDDTERAVGLRELARRLHAMAPGTYRRLSWLAAISFGIGMIEAGLLVLLAPHWLKRLVHPLPGRKDLPSVGATMAFLVRARLP